jgi:hypothetical protein
MSLRWLVALLLLVSQAALAQIEPWKANPRYWSYRGEPVLLVGGSDDDNLFQWPAAQLIPQLDRLKTAGGNVVRNTMSDRRDKGFEIYPYLRLPSGRYDLDQWNPEYWQRFERFLQETASRGIVVQIELWDRFDFSDHGKVKHWLPHPYNPANNVNYSYWRSGFAPGYYDHPGKNQQPFFFTTPEQRNNTLVLNYQQRYINKVLEHALKYDHVLYCIDNETKAEEAWSRYWTRYIKARAAQQGKRIYVTEMLDDKGMDKRIHGRTLDHPELYDFVEVSQNNHSNGRKHWENLLDFREHLQPQPRPMNSIKVYGATGNSFGHNDQDALERFWRNLLGGTALVRFHRPGAGLGLNDKAVGAIRSARALEQVTPLWQLEPVRANGTAEPAHFEARGKEGMRVVYFPRGGQAALQLQAGVSCSIAWLNLESAEWKPRQPCGKEATLRLSAPTQANWMAVLASP